MAAASSSADTATGSATATAQPALSLPPPKLEVGTRVTANYDNRGEFFPGKIVNKRSNGTYDVWYDDGDREERVKPDLIRAIPVAPVAVQDDAATPSKSKYKINLYM
jgi:hypothetical protein